MKKLYGMMLLGVLLGCARSVSDPPVPNPPAGPFANTILGKWVLVETQAPGNGLPGAWLAAAPAGQLMDIQPGGNITGSVFPTVTGYQLTDSITVKMIDPTQTAGCRLFNYKIDTVARALFLYIRPANGALCYEGCGGLKFTR